MKAYFPVFRHAAGAAGTDGYIRSDCQFEVIPMSDMKETNEIPETAANTSADANSVQAEGTPAPKKPVKSYRRKSRGWKFYALIALLTAILIFSGYKIVDILSEYHEGDSTYDDLEKWLLEQTLPVSSSESGESLPVLPTGSTETPGTQPSQPAQPTQSGQPSKPQSDETAAAGTESYVPEQSTEKEPEIIVPNILPYLALNIAALKEANPDTVGWLHGQNGSLSYPLVQGKDNEFYLSHLFDGTKNNLGTLFVDYTNHFLQDDLTMIYGHHMKNGSMFGRLENYKTQKHFIQNPVLHLYTVDKTYDLQVFAAVMMKSSENYQLNYGSEEAFNQAFRNYINRSSISTGIVPQYGDKIVGLYTCDYNARYDRFTVFCIVREVNP